MADRRSVFTDERIIEASRAFTCVADEVWRLQRGSEADCIFFQQAVNRGERITSQGSYQGTWIMAPSGKLLAQINSRNIDKQLETMQKGLDAWSALSPAERKLPAGIEFRPLHRWELNYPEQGLVLERIGRELGPEGLAGAPQASWNVDYAWATQAEMREQLAPGGELPSFTANLDGLALRLARFHLVDNVRGQTLPFARQEIHAASLRAKVYARDQTELELKLRGSTKAETDDTWQMGESSWKPSHQIPHGIECELIGSATWNIEEQRFTRFELLAFGKRWGRTGNNGRGHDPSPGRVAFHFEIPAGARRIAPTFINAYAAAWLRAPTIAEWIHSPEECGLELEQH